jgi:hypothetical protein
MTSSFLTWQVVLACGGVLADVGVGAEDLLNAFSSRNAPRHPTILAHKLCTPAEEPAVRASRSADSGVGQAAPADSGACRLRLRPDFANPKYMLCSRHRRQSPSGAVAMKADQRQALTTLTKARLRELAEAFDLDAPAGLRKAEVVELLARSRRASHRRAASRRPTDAAHDRPSRDAPASR